MTSAMVAMDLEKHNLSKLLKEKEQQLGSSNTIVAKQVAELDALKEEVVALKEVRHYLNCLSFTISVIAS